MTNLRFPKKKRKGDPRLQLREHPSDKEPIPMDTYLSLYGKLMGGKNDAATSTGEVGTEETAQNRVLDGDIREKTRDDANG
jgi:hypothetical protein